MLQRTLPERDQGKKTSKIYRPKKVCLLIGESYGRGAGVGRDRGVGLGLGVAVGVGVGVGDGVLPAWTSNEPTSMRPLRNRQKFGPR